MPVLAHQDTITGPLTAADLEHARQVNPGSIWQPHRHILLAAGCGQQGRYPTRADFVDTIPTDMGAFDDGAAVEGGKHRDPVESMLQHRRVSSTVKWGLALACLLSVAGFASRAIWPLA